MCGRLREFGKSKHVVSDAKNELHFLKADTNQVQFKSNGETKTKQQRIKEEQEKKKKKKEMVDGRKWESILWMLTWRL